ncbi:MAG TPA: hypothetical protein ENG93_03100 [Nitrospirae bacterium]|nr:hypothetical protein [Nitrospirota bacterium]
MLYISVFDAKDNIPIEEINRERDEWYQKGKDKTFQKMCERIRRYEIVGKSPMRIIFVVETNNPQSINILSHHFGEGWTSVTYPAVQREIHEALEEDKYIIGGC